MSVSDGQQCNAAVLNGAFVSKTANSTIISQLTLNRVASGDEITDVQSTINDHEDRITQSEADISQLELDVDQAQTDITALQAEIQFSNLSANTDPTPSNDLTEGYQVGSRWINTTDLRIFIALDVSTGAAVWKRTDKERLAVSFFDSLDMSVSNITDAAYVELVSDSGAEEIKKITSFYPAGSLAYIAIGAAASEVDEFILYPGGSEELVSIPPNSRISIKLLTGQTTVSSGVLAINFLTEV